MSYHVLVITICPVSVTNSRSIPLLDVIRSADQVCGYEAIREGLMPYSPSISPTSFEINNYFNYKRDEFLLLPNYTTPEDCTQ